MQTVTEGTHLAERLREVWSRRKWLALVAFALTMAAGVTVALSAPDVYRATATLIVEEPRVEASVAGELDRRLQMIAQEILSRARLHALIRRFGLYPELRQQASPEAAIQRIRADIRTEFTAPPVAGGTGATMTVAVSYLGNDPETVASVANELAGFYLEQDRTIRARQASSTVQVLRAQLEDLKRSLDEHEREVTAFQEDHLGELPQQSDANLAALDQLHADLRAVTDERMRALDRRNDLLRRLAEVDRSGAAAGVDPRTGRLAKLKEELADLQRRYSDRYPDVVRLKAEIAALESRQVGGAPEEASRRPGVEPRSSDVSSKEAAREIEQQIEALKSDEARLRSGISSYIARLENAPRRERAFQKISRDYEATRELYDTLRKRYEQAQLEEGSQADAAGPRFRILDTAVVPAAPTAPNRLFLLLFAVAASIGAAVGAASLAERLDTSFHSADDVRAFTRVPVLASIPRMITTGDLRFRRRRFGVAAVSIALAMGAVVHLFHGLARDNAMIVSILAKIRS